MNNLERTRSAASATIATNSSTTATLRLDTLGYDYASIDVVYGTVLAAGTNSAAAQTLTLRHSDSASTGYDTISGYPTVTTAGAVSTANASIIRFDVDMRGRRRYLEVATSPNTLCTVVIVGRLGKGEVGPVTASEMNVSTKYAG